MLASTKAKENWELNKDVRIILISRARYKILNYAQNN